MTRAPHVLALGRLVGTWTTEATHPAMPGVVVYGTAVAEWLEGEHFLILRAHTDHPEFPDGTSIMGCMEQDRVDGSAREEAAGADLPLRMHYFDSRGVFRMLEMTLDADTWHLERIAGGFSQRFTGRFSDGGDTIVGLWQLCRDDAHWADDLAITYRRKRPA